MPEQKENVEHSHHHHHHHHHHHKSKKKTKNKFLKFLGKYKLQITGVAVFAVLLTCLIVYVVKEPPVEEGQETTPTGQLQATEPPIQVEVGRLALQAPYFSEPLPLTRDGARAWMNAPITADVAQVLAAYHDSGKRQDIGAPVALSFDVLSLPADTTVVAFLLEVADNKDFDGAWSYDLDAGERSTQLWNLKTGTTYHYRLTAYLSDGTESGIFGSFETEAGLRIFNIDGIRNVRDLGGWATVEGKVLPQGLLYRGSELDGAVQSTFKITEAGRDELLTKLGVKTDMDLRAPGVGEAVLGANVNYTAYGAPSPVGIFSETGKSAIRNVFADLAKPENYPIYLHGTQGDDRTGTVCYLLGALLGVSEEDLIREYELSALKDNTVSRDQLRDMVNRLETYAGETMQEKVENYLLETGITPPQIAAIRSIWLG